MRPCMSQYSLKCLLDDVHHFGGTENERIGIGSWHAPGIFNLSAGRRQTHAGIVNPSNYNENSVEQWKGISAPFKHADFDGSLCLPIPLWLWSHKAKCSQFSDFQNSVFTTV